MKYLPLLCLLCGYLACKHIPPSPPQTLSLEGIALDLWTDGEMLFGWGEVEGRRARVVFSSVELGNFLAGAEACARGPRIGQVLTASGEEREVVRLENWSLEGRAPGSVEVAWVDAPKVPSAAPSTLLRLRDGFVLEEDDTECILVLGAQQMDSVHMVFEKGRLQFQNAAWALAEEEIRFAEHLQLGIPFGQFMVFINEKRIPMRLVLDTSQWPSYVHGNFFSGQGIVEDTLRWEALGLSPKVHLPAGHFELQNSAKLNRYWPWADGNMGMQAFECCRLLWSPREGKAQVQGR